MFERSTSYRRKDLHQAYGGQSQGGISTPTHESFLLIFTGETGEQYGYRDGWEPDGTFLYTGEGQKGDMTFVRGNRAIRDHALNGKDLHLFRYVGKGMVRYEGQMACAGYQLRQGIPDIDGNQRIAIVFQLVPVDDLSSEPTVKDPDEQWCWDAPIEEVRAAALRQAEATTMPGEARRRVYRRSQAVRAYVLRRSGGICEGCGAVAPFKTRLGRPYLEPHHTRRLSDGGPDHPRWVSAVCPNCHRRAHHAMDSETYNAFLQKKAGEAEGE